MRLRPSGLRWQGELERAGTICRILVLAVPILSSLVPGTLMFAGIVPTRSRLGKAPAFPD